MEANKEGLKVSRGQGGLLQAAATPPINAEKLSPLQAAAPPPPKTPWRSTVEKLSVSMEDNGVQQAPPSLGALPPSGVPATADRSTAESADQLPASSPTGKWLGS